MRSTGHTFDRYSAIKTRYGIQYFRGAQPAVDYANPAEVAYLHSNIQVRSALYRGLTNPEQLDLAVFGALLVRLHRLMQYRPLQEWLHNQFATSAQSDVVQGHVLNIARRHNDPYADGRSNGPHLPGIPPSGQPRDASAAGTITHHYPSLDFADAYLIQVLKSLKKLPHLLDDRDAYVRQVASMLQYLNNLHLFAGINSSLYMNIANGLLEIAGIAGIEHGIIDFVSMRLQPTNFQQYFLDQVNHADADITTK